MSAPSTLEPAAARDALAGKLFADLIASLESLAVYLGVRLGLYRCLDESGPATPVELAARAGIDQRYAREWLEQQAVTGVLTVDDAEPDPERRRYVLPGPHREVLVDELSPWYLAAAPFAVAGCARVLPELLAAYRTGAGVPYAAFGDDIRDHIEQLNRPGFHNDLADTWVAAVPGLAERLSSEPPARVADIACGAGWASIALARGFPRIHVDGYDLDEASIARARGHAADAGVADRVSFAVADGVDILPIEHDLWRFYRLWG